MMRIFVIYFSGIREQIDDLYTLVHHTLFYDVTSIEFEYNGEVKKTFTLS